jgi:hypothetical protein
MIFILWNKVRYIHIKAQGITFTWLSTLEQERYVPNCTTQQEDDLNSWRRCQRSQMQPYNVCSFVNNPTSKITTFVVFKSLEQCLIQLMPRGWLSGQSIWNVHTRGMKLGCRYRIAFTELKLGVSCLLNLGINNKGVVIYLWWHNPTT